MSLFLQNLDARELTEVPGGGLTLGDSSRDQVP